MSAVICVCALMGTAATITVICLGVATAAATRRPGQQEVHRHGSDEPEDEPTSKHEPTATAFGDKVVSHLPLEWMLE